MTLDTCSPNETYIIQSIGGTVSQRRHLYHIGFLEGNIIRCVYTAPYGDPVAFEVQGSIFALRRNQMKNIVVCKGEVNREHKTL